MIKYELAKELKDSGYPQNNHETKCSCCWFEWYDEDSEEHELWNTNEIELSENYVYVPTLSELIEACGEIELIKKIDALIENELAITFTYEAYTKEPRVLSFIDSTPEEAVARLWLALNKK